LSGQNLIKPTASHSHVLSSAGSLFSTEEYILYVYKYSLSRLPFSKTDLTGNIQTIPQRTVTRMVATAVKATNKYRGRAVKCDKKSIQYLRFNALANFNTALSVCKL
jgi:hypothetical protein